MAKMEIGEDIQSGNVGGGGGFGQPDTSDDLKDMGNYEAAVNKVEIFKMLAQLKVMKEGTDKAKYQYLTMDASDIADFKAASMGAAGHGVNSQFAALGAPYRAVPFSTKDAVKVEKTVKRGDKIGTTKEVKETDSIKIYRASEKFDESLYAVKGWGRTNKDEEELVYETFTVGQGLRAEKFLATVDEKLIKTVGIIVE